MSFNLRGPVALLLVFSVWMSAIAFLPVSAAAQVKTDDSAKSKQAVSKNSETKATEQPTPQSTAPSNLKPLSANEDPSQIGKRNINSGSDKFFGWLGGSQQKEMQIGRQLALEVEQQAKMVDDPMITE
jgi:hypothetical protein